MKCKCEHLEDYPEYLGDSETEMWCPFIEMWVLNADIPHGDSERLRWADHCEEGLDDICAAAQAIV